MEFIKSILAGVAGSAIFWFIDKQLLTFSQPYQIGGIVIVFLVCVVGFWLGRGQVKTGIRLLSGNKFKDGMTTTIEKASIVAKGSGADVLSANKVSGPAKIKIKDTTIKS